MVLSDRDIKMSIRKKELVFNPDLTADQIGPASIDLKLNDVFKVFNTEKQSLLDIREKLPKDFTKTIKLRKKEHFVLHPNNFVIASTVEWIKVPDDMVVRVEGKSSLARMGILVHTAGFIDPGFEGNITLEISNQSNIAIAIYPNMYICQIACEYLSSPAETPYDKRKKSLYRKQKGPTAADTRNLF
ncbi:MAG: dCTP deaminase [Candidatus Pacebacteria bacterium]|jgi:dCTP deaminase|nr:dCTP deaminase [Parcubacteria group bacterium]MDP6249571.1 dCTP deaminase [Candidatus Paceibacterota bacterium]MDP7159005.1 dCTP deaminase [Candidatus Paceibacterota bacterium]MDP7366559.1 dCTP deaminase [Candidatus Paceibacterota bacterium]MDP7466421.1 dCTP deaminase [Candidatus Paceibacterota bacterium]|tara:strand:- start:19815 stop:20375 length:561 start_codon:yes stop_codon:yes gene_type:complete